MTKYKLELGFLYSFIKFVMATSAKGNAVIFLKSLIGKFFVRKYMVDNTVATGCCLTTASALCLISFNYTFTPNLVFMIIFSLIATIIIPGFFIKHRIATANSFSAILFGIIRAITFSRTKFPFSDFKGVNSKISSTIKAFYNNVRLCSHDFDFTHNFNLNF